jgi:hypothetical protein
MKKKATKVILQSSVSLLGRLSICVALFGWCLFSYMDKQNEVTQLKIKLPELEKKIGTIREESRRLRYEIDQFENPSHLIELAHRPEFGHLRHPLLREILTVPEAVAIND